MRKRAAVGIMPFAINADRFRLHQLPQPGLRRARHPPAGAATLAGELGSINLAYASYPDITSIVINAGAFTHTSIAILDALNAYDGPVIEVHISNVHKREEFRHHSFISARADGVIVGCGTQGYAFGIARIAALHGQ